MDNGQFPKQMDLATKTGENSFEAQNDFTGNLNQGPQETIRKIDEIANPELALSEEKKEIQMEMPPGEEVEIPENESDKANLEIRDFGNNGKFGSGNFAKMKKVIVAASNNPYELANAIQELSEETSGIKKAA